MHDERHKSSWRADRAFRASRRRAGFTYTEILIVVGIVAMVALAASLSLRGQFPRYRIRDAAGRLQAQLRAARLHAISRSRQVNVSLDLINRRLRTTVDEDGDGTLESNEVATVLLSSVPSLTLSSITTAGVFTAAGDFTTANGFWRVAVSHAGGDTQYVYVFQGGHVQASEVPLD